MFAIGNQLCVHGGIDLLPIKSFDIASQIINVRNPNILKDFSSRRRVNEICKLFDSFVDEQGGDGIGVDYNSNEGILKLSVMCNKITINPEKSKLQELLGVPGNASVERDEESDEESDENGIEMSFSFQGIVGGE